MPSRSKRTQSAPGRFDSPQTHQCPEADTVVSPSREVNEGVVEPAQPGVTAVQSSSASQYDKGKSPYRLSGHDGQDLDCAPCPSGNGRCPSQGDKETREIVVHIPQTISSALPLMSPSPNNTPSHSNLATPHLGEPSFHAHTEVTQAEDHSTWARTSPSQAPLLFPEGSEPETPFRLPRSMYQVDSLPGVFDRYPWAGLNPLARPFIPAALREHKSTGVNPPPNDFCYDDFNAHAGPSSEGTGLMESPEIFPPQYSRPAFSDPCTGFTYNLLYSMANDTCDTGPVPHWEPQSASVPTHLIQFGSDLMYPEFPNAGRSKLVNRKVKHSRARQLHTGVFTPPLPVDEARLVSPLLCDLGGQDKADEMIAPLQALAKAYNVKLPDPDHPLSDSGLKTLIRTIVKLFLRYYDDRRPIEAQCQDTDRVSPPDQLWLWVHTAHIELLRVLHPILKSLLRDCEGTQRGVALALLDRIAVDRIKSSRFASKLWRQRQCALARENNYWLESKERPTDLTRATWREVALLLKQGGWEWEHEPYLYTGYGTTY